MERTFALGLGLGSCGHGGWWSRGYLVVDEEEEDASVIMTGHQGRNSRTRNTISPHFTINLSEFSREKASLVICFRRAASVSLIISRPLFCG